MCRKYRLPRWLRGKESASQCRRCRFDPWVKKIPWRRKWQPTPAFLPVKPHGQRSPAGSSPWDHKRIATKQHVGTYIQDPNLVGILKSLL